MGTEQLHEPRSPLLPELPPSTAPPAALDSLTLCFPSSHAACRLPPTACRPLCACLPAAFSVARAATNFSPDDIISAMKEGQRAVWAKLPAIQVRVGGRREAGRQQAVGRWVGGWVGALRGLLSRAAASSPLHTCTPFALNPPASLQARPSSCPPLALPPGRVRRGGLHRRAAAAFDAEDAAASPHGAGGDDVAAAAAAPEAALVWRPLAAAARRRRHAPLPPLLAPHAFARCARPGAQSEPLPVIPGSLTTLPPPGSGPGPFALAKQSPID